MSLDRAAPARLLADRSLGRVFAALAAPGEETRIVGGAIRNALIGRAVREIDLATTAPPADTFDRASKAGLKAIKTGFVHGTVTVIADGRPFEVTTLREDVETDGRHAVVRFGRDFARDAARRDFTVNALSLDAAGGLHDYTDGLADLASGRIRFIGDPGTRIREDYLRILRFFRFSAEYAEGPLDRPALDAATLNRDGLARLSAERIRAELLKLLAAGRAPEIVAALQATGLLTRLTGGVGELGRLSRAVAAGLDPVARLAALLVLSPIDPPRLRDRLRLSNAETMRLDAYARTVAQARTPERLDAADIRRLAVAFGRDDLVAGLAVLAGEPRPAFTGDGRLQADRYGAGEAAPVFPLTGTGIVASGTPPGPEVGRRLRAERDAWLAAGAPSRWPATVPAEDGRSREPGSTPRTSSS